MRNRAMLEGKWNPDGDTYLADFRMVLAISLAYQKRYAEAFPLAELWERVHLKFKEPDDPFILNVVIPHMRRMRARVAGIPYPWPVEESSQAASHDAVAPKNMGTRAVAAGVFLFFRGWA